MAKLSIRWDPDGPTLVAEGPQVSLSQVQAQFARATIGGQEYDLILAGNPDRAIAVPIGELAWLEPNPTERREWPLRSWFRAECVGGTWRKA
jgi:hypothetical protein